MDLGRFGHLSYSTLVHPADTWADLKASLVEYLPRVKERVCPGDAMGVSLRLSRATVSTLLDQPAELEWLASFFRDNDLSPYTVNAFPYGPFKDQVVMEDVYEPDWTTDERVDYTIDVAKVLVKIVGPGVSPSIQTAPLAFAAKATEQEYRNRFTTNVLRVIAALEDLEGSTGIRVKLALEPEPACFLETTDETVAYFRNVIYSSDMAREYASIAGCPLSEAFGAIRRYLGVVLDIGHQSVGFEDIRQSIDSLVNAGIPIFKLQEAAALWIEDLTPDVVPQLRVFTDTIYLSQTTVRTVAGVKKYLHLRDALDAYEASPEPTELRCHFHVPVFLDSIGPFRTTRFAVEEALRYHRETPLSDHLEIETYTWDVLPSELKTGDIVDYVSRELEFVRSVVTGEDA